jgi:hypothetical protein
MTDEDLAAMHKLLGGVPSQARQGSSAQHLCNNITSILRSDLRMRLPRYPGARRFWNALTNANSEKRWRPPG